MGDTPVVLFAARFAAQKQPRLLAEIVRALKSRGRTFTLLLAGDGPDRAWLEENLCRKYPESVRMIGAINPGEIREIMSLSDLLVLPSQSEGIALVLFEAMSMGVVPVATDVGGQRELVTAECGVLVPFDEQVVLSLVAALDLLLGNAPLRAKMAAAGRKRIAEKFQLDFMGNRANEIFTEVARVPAGRLWASIQEMDWIASLPPELVELEKEEIAADAWNRRRTEGKWLPRIVSSTSEFIRKTPLRRWFRRLEIRYGERVGRWIIRS